MTLIITHLNVLNWFLAIEQLTIDRKLSVEIISRNLVSHSTLIDIHSIDQGQRTSLRNRYYHSVWFDASNSHIWLLLSSLQRKVKMLEQWLRTSKWMSCRNIRFIRLLGSTIWFLILFYLTLTHQRFDKILQWREFFLFDQFKLVNKEDKVFETCVQMSFRA